MRHLLTAFIIHTYLHCHSLSPLILLQLFINLLNFQVERSNVTNSALSDLSKSEGSTDSNDISVGSSDGISVSSIDSREIMEAPQTVAEKEQEEQLHINALINVLWSSPLLSDPKNAQGLWVLTRNCNTVLYIPAYIHTYIENMCCPVDVLASAIQSWSTKFASRYMHTYITFIHMYIHTYIHSFIQGSRSVCLQHSCRGGYLVHHSRAHRTACIQQSGYGG